MNNIIHQNAKLGNNVTVGDYTSIHDDVIIGEGTKIHSNVVIYPGTRIGKNCEIFPGAIIGAIPQDLKFRGECTTLEIGDYNVFREYVTLNRGTIANGKTVVGNNNTFLAYSHLGHDSMVGNNVVISNNVQMAGHVTVDDYVVIGGLCGIHQFCSIGKHAMLGAMSGLGSNVPPYTTASRAPAKYKKTNFVGLRRNNFSREDIKLIGSVYAILYDKKHNFSDAIKTIKNKFEPVEIVKTIIDFLEKHLQNENDNKYQVRGIIKAE